MENYKEPRKRSNPHIKNMLATISPVEKAKIANKMLLAIRLNELLSAKKWTKSQLASKLNQEPSVITKWLSGTHNFTMDTLTEIAEVFSIPLAMIIAPKETQVVFKTKIALVAHNANNPQLTPNAWGGFGFNGNFPQMSKFPSNPIQANLYS